MRRATLFAMLVALLCAGPAQAARLITPDGERARPFQGWADEALVPTVQGYVVVLPADGSCGRSSACSDPKRPRAIWWRGHKPVAHEPAYERGVLYHELGHLFDYAVMTDATRAEFVRLLGHPGRPWRDPPNSPHEQFAEGYRLCALGWSPHYALFHGGTEYNYLPSRRVARRVCALIRGIAPQ